MNIQTARGLSPGYWEDGDLTKTLNKSQFREMNRFKLIFLKSLRNALCNGKKKLNPFGDFL